MKIFRSPIIRGVTLVALLSLTFFATASPAGLHTSVRKYKNVKVHNSHINRLREFDHLIRYFCSFSYYLPRHTVSPDFIRALILAESAGNPKAVSSKNALGLGQIIYTTGREAAYELSLSRTTFKYVSKERLRNLKEKDLFDPAVNILLTCFLIAKYNYRFDGRLELVLSAWNAGENTESLQYMKHAPYNETEELIGKVNGYFIYFLRNKIFR